ncbi:hypothetical protein ACHAWC_000502 [Mediolabrus comicus]
MDISLQPTLCKAKVYIAPSKSEVANTLSNLILQSCHAALVQSHRDIFTIALSGGSLPSLLSCLPEAFAIANIDPQWNKWHVILADERCVVSSDADSNLGAIRSNFTYLVDIPTSQIYGIDETLLLGGNDTADIAQSYQQNAVQPLLDKPSTDGMIDCAILGFGPDGHTCSLFPNHKLLHEETKLVASIDDSPKPPPSRITLTLPFLNTYVRQVIFCGVGESKRPILKAIFKTSSGSAAADDDNAGGRSVKNHQEILQLKDGARVTSVELCNPAPYPCGMVRPLTRNTGGEYDNNSLVWVVDEDAANGCM